ncbi:hypothetical protein SRB5_28570 [Streptomyces sp. RB5]|uniref:AB hydrolase-1 domain-containing protein n=1 Tax=Streptomyces smaragdinus TaxID=2585196 RepID=A0A7K0CGZ4_9ACTN|nr:alpha/beta fold hydrolase [Streptomyces smaragdinus]MQY12718.1 hypothetical protein [Streptomyces smaragdinus]
MTRTRVWTGAVAPVVLLALLTGCGDDGDSGTEQTSATPQAAPETSSGPNDFGCLKGDQLAGATSFEVDGEQVDAYRTGKGTTGVIFSHQVDLDLCSWVPAADELAADGYQALAVNSMSTEVDELVAAAKLLREKGAEKIILIGASKGGTGSLAAAAEIKPAVSAVVSLSGPAEFGDIDALAAAPKLTMPVYLIASRDDTRFFEDAQKLDKAATASKGEKFEPVNGIEHGNAILTEHPDVWKRVKAFVQQYGG